MEDNNNSNLHHGPFTVKTHKSVLKTPCLQVHLFIESNAYLFEEQLREGRGVI